MSFERERNFRGCFTPDFPRHCANIRRIGLREALDTLHTLDRLRTAHINKTPSRDRTECAARASNRSRARRVPARDSRPFHSIPPPSEHSIARYGSAHPTRSHDQALTTETS